MPRLANVAPTQAVNVLLIDDEIDALDEMSVCLKDKGYSCLTASSAGEAREVWRTAQPIGVIVTDVRMPEVDGLTLLAQFAADDSVAAPEGVVVTGHGSVDAAVAALRLHVADFLRKPVGGEDLATAVGMALDRYRARSHRVVEQQTLAAQLLQSTSVRLNHLIRELAPDAATAAGQGSAAGDDLGVDIKSVRRLVEQRALRLAIFENDMLAEVGVDMLLELLLAELEGRSVFVRNLCTASCLPTSTAMRRIDDLERLGLVVRTSDPVDRRRVVVQLSAEGGQRMRSYVRQIDGA